MALNSTTVRKLYEKRRRAYEAAAMRKPAAAPTIWELHRGVLDYRTGQWTRFHHVMQFATYHEAKKALRSIADYFPDNAAYITRRYVHVIDKETQKANS